MVNDRAVLTLTAECNRRTDRRRVEGRSSRRRGVECGMSLRSTLLETGGREIPRPRLLERTRVVPAASQSDQWINGANCCGPTRRLNRLSSPLRLACWLLRLSLGHRAHLPVLVEQVHHTIALSDVRLSHKKQTTQPTRSWHFSISGSVDRHFQGLLLIAKPWEDTEPAF